MSTDELAQKIADNLGSTIREAASDEVGLKMRDLPRIVRKEMDACLDGKCDDIASRLAEKLPRVEQHILTGEDVAKAVKEAMGEGGPSLTVKGHTAHDILDCPTCRPMVVEGLWKDEGYRQQVMEKVCEDDVCREAISKMFEEKGYEVRKHEEGSGREETWAERRLRERRERKPS